MFIGTYVALFFLFLLLITTDKITVLSHITFHFFFNIFHSRDPYNHLIILPYLSDTSNAIQITSPPPCLVRSIDNEINFISNIERQRNTSTSNVKARLSLFRLLPKSNQSGENEYIYIYINMTTLCVCMYVLAMDGYNHRL